MYEAISKISRGKQKKEEEAQMKCEDDKEWESLWGWASNFSSMGALSIKFMVNRRKMVKFCSWSFYVLATARRYCGLAGICGNCSSGGVFKRTPDIIISWGRLNTRDLKPPNPIHTREFSHAHSEDVKINFPKHDGRKNCGSSPTFCLLGIRPSTRKGENF